MFFVQRRFAYVFWVKGVSQGQPDRPATLLDVVIIYLPLYAGKPRGQDLP